MPFPFDSDIPPPLLPSKLSIIELVSVDLVLCPHSLIFTHYYVVFWLLEFFGVFFKFFIRGVGVEW